MSVVREPEFPLYFHWKKWIIIIVTTLSILISALLIVMILLLRDQIYESAQRQFPDLDAKTLKTITPLVPIIAFVVIMFTDTLGLLGAIKHRHRFIRIYLILDVILTVLFMVVHFGIASLVCSILYFICVVSFDRDLGHIAKYQATRITFSKGDSV